MVNVCRSAKHAIVHPEKPSLTAWTKGEGEDWSDDRIILIRVMKKSSWKTRNSRASESWFQPVKLPGVPGKGWGRDGVCDKNGGEQAYVSAETCKKILLILSCLDCFLKAWMYVVLRAVNMHVCMRTAGLRHPSKTGWRKK